MMLNKNPKTPLRIGLILLIAFFSMRMVERYAPSDVPDFLKGILLGAAAGCILLSVYITGRERRDRRA